MRPQSIHYVNHERMFREIDKFSHSKIKKKFQILNLGELGDPLATDDITEFSKIIIPYAAQKDNIKILFLTKSTKIENLLNLEHNDHTILSWSVNCDLIADKLEHKVPKPIDRIKSASEAENSGYEIRFRIDPLFWFEGWEEQYTKLVDEIATFTKPTLLTLGAYRPSQGLVNHIRSRFPRSNLIKLEEQLIMDAGKKRFSDNKRVIMYHHISELIKKKLGDVPVALCKEPIKIWKAAGFKSQNMICNCTDFVL